MIHLSTAMRSREDRSGSSRLLSLPYDVRYVIYQHLFPSNEQIYIQALDDGLHSILPDDPSPASIFQVCRQLRSEAGGFLYNSYLFNIVGTKKDCLANYKRFLQTLRRHARSEVNINAFSNGTHSSTMCLSLQAGDAKMGVLNRRRRGEPRTIEELLVEQQKIEPPHRAFFAPLAVTMAPLAVLPLGAALIAAVIAALAWSVTWLLR